MTKLIVDPDGLDWSEAGRNNVPTRSPGVRVGVRTSGSLRVSFGKTLLEELGIRPGAGQSVVARCAEKDGRGFIRVDYPGVDFAGEPLNLVVTPHRSQPQIPVSAFFSIGVHPFEPGVVHRSIDVRHEVLRKNAKGWELLIEAPDWAAMAVAIEAEEEA